MTNNKFQNAINRIPQNCPPIWFMRQAGRYHDHYQNLKKTYTFEQLCKTPELAAETAMGPIRDFDFDVSILFSDILFPLEALGLGLAYNPGPQIDPLLKDLNCLKNFKSHDEASNFLKFQAEAVKCTREELPNDKSLIGFIGGPWTLFTYAKEGVHKGNMIVSKTNQELFHGFCEQMIPLLSYCIDSQLKAGAEVVMIFDTSAGELSPVQFNEVVIPPLTQLTNKFPGKIGYYAKGTTWDQVNTYKDLPLAGRGFDHRYDLKNVLQTQKDGFIQGNFDQTLLFLSSEEFEKRSDQFIERMKELNSEERAGWVCGLGHGVLPKTPQENVRRFISKVREAFND